MLGSPLFPAEEARTRALRRGWGGALLEDIWFGSLLHRAARRKMTYVQEDDVTAVTAVTTVTAVTVGRWGEGWRREVPHLGLPQWIMVTIRMMTLNDDAE